MHRNARLTVWSRKELVRRHLEGGLPLCRVAEQMNVSRQTASKWWHRYLADPDGLWYLDRSSRPHRCPHQTPGEVEERIVAIRQSDKIGPVRIGWRVDVAPSTVHRVLRRRGLNRLAHLDRPTGRRVRRYERDRPGELVHVDIKKLGRIPTGGGWRVHGRRQDPTKGRARVGYGYVHAAVDDHSRFAYVEVLDDELATTAVAFCQRAVAWFGAHGVEVEAIMTDNGSCYRSRHFADTLAAADITHVRIPPRQPQINGKVCEYRFGRRRGPGLTQAKV